MNGNIKELKKQRLTEKLGKIKDGEVRELITCSLNGKLRTLAERILTVDDDGYMYHWTRNNRSAAAWFDAHEDGLRVLFGDRFDGFRSGIAEFYPLHEYSLADSLDQMIFISCSDFCDAEPESISGVEDWTNGAHGDAYVIGDEYFGGFDFVKSEFKKAVKEGRLSVGKIIAACRKDPRLIGLFIVILSESADEAVADYFCELIETAGLQDTIRMHVFRAVFDIKSGSRFLVGRIIEKARADKWYSLPAFYETLTYGDVHVSLPIDKRMRIMEDALARRFDRYLKGRIDEFFFLAAALYAFDRESFVSVLTTAINGDNILLRRAALVAATDFANDLTPYADKLISLADVFDLEDWAVLTASYARKALCSPSVIARLFAILDGMTKTAVSYKTDENFNFSRDLKKWLIVETLHDFYKATGDAAIVRELEKRYDKLGTEAQITFFEKFKDNTELDIRKAAIAMLKQPSWEAQRFYDGRKLILTYDEAVFVSDFLKTKKQDLKSRIIKELLKSKDKERIAEYLAAQPEEYKTAAAAEMYSALGIAPPKKTDAAAEPDKTAVVGATKKTAATDAPQTFRLDYVAPPSDALVKRVKPLKPKSLKPKRISALLEKLEAFINENADYEYISYYADATVTLGSHFGLVVSDDMDSRKLSSFPLGEELGKVVKKCLDAEELGVFVMSCKLFEHHATPASVEKFGKLLGCEDALKYLDSLYRGILAKRSAPLTSIVSSIPSAVLYETAPRMMFEIALYLLEQDFYFGFDHLITEMYFYSPDPPDADKLELFVRRRMTAEVASMKKALAEADDDAAAKIAAMSEYSSHSKGFFVSAEVFAEMYELGVFEDAEAEYLCIAQNTRFDGLFEPQSIYYVGEDNDCPKTAAFAKAFAEKMVDAETKRGSLPTVYSRLIGRIDNFFGLETYFKAAAAMRGLTPCRDYFLDTSKKNDAITHILKRTIKDDGDCYEKYERLCSEYGLTKEELIRATLINPIYIDHAEKYLGMRGLKMTVYWFTAHLNEQLTDARKEKIKEFSEISPDDFKDGAFDRKWYDEMISTVSKDDFKLVYDNAKYITMAGLHKRAQRFFDAINGKLTLSECKAQIEKSRNKDYCLCYSLVPLKDRADLMARYKYLGEFLDLGKQFGAMRKASERRTVDIALENLARAAGYKDVNIFIYETEALDPSELFREYVIDGVKIAPNVDGYRVTLAAEKDGKLVKLPTSLGKNKTVVELRAMAREETARIKRMRAGFERSMCERVEFTAEQLELICRQPVIDYLLSRLFFIADGGAAVLSGGKLSTLGGEPIAARTAVIAHPVELKRIGALQDCITYVVKNNIKQPFKQALREIYEPTEKEKKFTDLLRFKGFNVSINKCFAALKNKGWAYSPDVGTRRVFYSSDTIAVIFRDFDLAYTYDWDGEERELDCVWFIGRKSGEPMRLGDVDPITFSETCRDVDLVVTISANNIFDFENAMSTVEVRKNILVSLCDILHLDNVGFIKDNIKINGVHGVYVVNIRTGLVFKEGVGQLAIATTRTGRRPLLLDFVDEDPMTADIISKAIILSDDANIDDNAILSQVEK